MPSACFLCLENEEFLSPIFLVHLFTSVLVQTSFNVSWVFSSNMKDDIYQLFGLSVSKGSFIMVKCVKSSLTRSMEGKELEYFRGKTSFIGRLLWFCPLSSFYNMVFSIQGFCWLFFDWLISTFEMLLLCFLYGSYSLKCGICIFEY